MTRPEPLPASKSPTFRLICLATDVPEGMKAGHIPARSALGHLPDFARLWGHVAPLYRPTAVVCAPDVQSDTWAQATRIPLVQQEALRDRSYGLWHGLALRDVPRHELARFLQEPECAPNGAESAHAFQARIGTWVEGAALQGRIVLVARPAVVRALAVHALGGDCSLANRLDAEPKSLSVLTRHAGLWRVRQYGVALPDLERGWA